MAEADRIAKTIHRNKPTVAVVTDSVAQVPKEIARQLDITVVPMSVNIGGELYLDGIDIEPAVLYRRMRVEMILPTTTAPTPVQFQEAFHARLLAGAQALLCLTLSNKLSSSYNSACLAAEKVRADYPDRTIEVLDSQLGGISQGFVVIAAARAAAEGKLILEVLQLTREAIPRAGLAVALETLEYLARGGRIGKAAFMMGSLINIRPIVTIDREGSVIPLRKVRGENHALQAIVDHVARQVDGCQKLYLCIMEADAPQQASRLQELALQRMKPFEIFHSEFTPVMGVHAGPGVVGLGYYYE